MLFPLDHRNQNAKVHAGLIGYGVHDGAYSVRYLIVVTVFDLKFLVHGINPTEISNGDFLGDRDGAGIVQRVLLSVYHVIAERIKEFGIREPYGFMEHGIALP